jgi:NADH-quinone oxidoreductase subunit E
MESLELEQIVEKYRYDEASLIGILQDIQKREGYLPQDMLRNLAKLMGVSLSQIYGLATFYKSFRLKPRGRNCVTVCLGTACHVRGAPRILDRAKQVTGIEPGDTTPDLKFSLETVNCLGCCALGAMMVVNEEYHSHTGYSDVQKILESCE